MLTFGCCWAFGYYNMSLPVVTILLLVARIMAAAMIYKGSFNGLSHYRFSLCPSRLSALMTATLMQGITLSGPHLIRYRNSWNVIIGELQANSTSALTSFALLRRQLQKEYGPSTT